MLDGIPDHQRATELGGYDPAPSGQIRFAA
jgi:hypothetical protein